MKKELRPHIEEDRLGINPFVQHLKVPVNTVTMAGQYKPDKDGLILPLEIELEKDSYCRVYSDSGRRKDMVGLSPRAKDLLLWVIYELESAKDWIWINKARYMKECGVSSYNTYKTALRELIVKGFMQPTVVLHVYWINPKYFFNGSRIAKYPKNVVRK